MDNMASQSMPVILAPSKMLRRSEEEDKKEEEKIEFKTGNTDAVIIE